MPLFWKLFGCVEFEDLEKDEVSKNKAKQTDINKVQEALKTRYNFF